MKESQRACQAIVAFRREFGKPHLTLAYHAAFPLALTPDLLYQIWGNFRQDLYGNSLEIPWIAVADLLLSPLCSEIGSETYAMDDAVRHLLLRRLWKERRFRANGGHRLLELAGFMRQYAQRQRENSNLLRRDMAEAEQLNALVHLVPQAAITALRQAYEKGVTARDRATLIRLDSLVSTFTTATQIARPAGDAARTGFEELQTYAQEMSSLARGRKSGAEVDASLRRRLGSHGRNPLVAGQPMPAPRDYTGQPVDDLELLHSQLTFPTGDIFPGILPGQKFIQAWEIKNTGQNKWGEGYQLVSEKAAAGEPIAGSLPNQLPFSLPSREHVAMFGEPTAVPLPPLNPGETETVRVEFTAPEQPGPYADVWQAYNAQGEPFGEPLKIDIEVAVEPVKPDSLLDFSALVSEKGSQITDHPFYAVLSEGLAERNQPRLFMLTGDTGSGKTEIAARLVRFTTGAATAPEAAPELRPEFLNAYHFCRSDRPETVDPGIFIRSLALQMAARWQNFGRLLPPPEQEMGLEETYERWLKRPLANFLEDNLPPSALCFLVDGLDKALLYAGDPCIVDIVHRLHQDFSGAALILTSKGQKAVYDKLPGLTFHTYTLDVVVENLDITVGPASREGFPVSVSLAEAGDRTEPVYEQPPTFYKGPGEIIDRLRHNRADPADAEMLGRNIFGFLLPQSARGLYEHHTERLRREGKRLRLRLTLPEEAPELEAIPWEFLYDEHRFPALAEERLFVRTLPLPAVPPPATFADHLRVLDIIASPADLPAVNKETAHNLLRRALEPWLANGRVRLQSLTAATPEEISRTLGAFAPHIVHLTIPGVEQDGRRMVYFLENADGRSLPFERSQFAKLFLSQEEHLRLLLLNVEKPASLATALLGMGNIPAVVAWQLSLPDPVAREAVQVMYEGLVAGVGLDTAVQRTRRALFTRHPKDSFWGSPSLIMRQGDTPIWRFDQEAEVKAEIKEETVAAEPPPLAAGPATKPPWIYGLHDPGNWDTVFTQQQKTGWVLFHQVLGERRQEQPPSYAAWADKGFGLLTRLVHAPFDLEGKGEGSIPLPEAYDDFARRCAQFVRQSPSCAIWLIGNEMNMSWHWPNRTEGRRRRRVAEPITPDLYAPCFNRVYRAIKAVQPEAWVIPSGLNPQMVGQDAGRDTLVWFREMIDRLEAVDGFDVHAYFSAGDEPPPTGKYTFDQFLDAIPARWRDRPVFITEATPLEVWPEQSRGWMQAAYAEVDRWNRAVGHQKVYALLPYRWQGRWPDGREDPWNLVNKPTYLEDLAAALQQDYRWQLNTTSQADITDTAPSPFDQDAAVESEEATFADLEQSQYLIQEIFERLVEEESHISGARGHGRGAEAFNALRESNVTFGNPTDRLIRLTPELLQSMDITLDPIVSAQMQNQYDFYFMAMPVAVFPKRGELFNRVECRLAFEVASDQQVVMHALFPTSKWLRVLRWGGEVNLALNGNLDWDVGVDPARLDEVKNLGDVPAANLKTADEVKSRILMPNFAFELGRQEIVAAGEGKNFCHWRLRDKELNTSNDLRFVVIFKVTKGVKQVRMSGLVLAEPNMELLAAEVGGIFSQLSERIKNVFRKPDHERQGAERMPISNFTVWERLTLP